MVDKKPHDIYTWEDEADCYNCALLGKLICKWEGKRLAGFAGIYLPSHRNGKDPKKLGLRTSRWILE
jgi:hypothetical protein